MLPLLVDPSRLRILVVGAGAAAERRHAILAEAGATDVASFAAEAPSMAQIAAAHLVFIAGLPRAAAAEIAQAARAARVLVHVEDAPEFSDLHAPSVLRRGDLTIAVSTNGKSPGLARRVRRHLETWFGAEWRDRLDEIGELRRCWRESGAGLAEIARWTEEWADRRGWFDAPAPARDPSAGDAAVRRQ